MTSDVFDISEARLSHLCWEMALSDMIAGSVKRLDAYEACPLGKWLDGEGARLYGDNKTYMVLRVAHKQFHRLADEIIRNVHEGHGLDLTEHMEKIKHVSQQVLFLLTSIELESREQQNARFVKIIRNLTPGRQEKVDSQNFKFSISDARLIHLRWVGELQDILGGQSRINKIQSAENCALGRWLRQSMSTKESEIDLLPLDIAHCKFHRSVEDTVNALSIKDYRLADQSYSRVYDGSAEIILQLTRLELPIDRRRSSIKI
jgi:hypothetical protein